jgi:hypothetical protein
VKKAFFFELIENGSKIYCYIKAVGKLTHEDYETFVPSFEQLLKNIKEPKVKVLADLSEFEGWEMQAAWDDLKFGLSHNNDFEKIAVAGHSDLYKYGVKISNWFTPYEMHYFEDINKAKEWLEVK